jgi:hypothetical protein
VKNRFLIGVEILTPDRRLLDYGILEAKNDSLRLVTTRFKGTLLGGAVLVLFSSLYWFLISVPFLFFHAPPITSWDSLAEAVVVVAIPTGFVILLFLSMGLVRRVQIKYEKTSRTVTVSNIQPGRFGHVLVVKSDTESLTLLARGKRTKFLNAIALARAS